METVDTAFGGAGTPVHLVARLRECNYGRRNGRPVAHLAAERRRRIRDLVDAPFQWREGWQFLLPAGWPANLHP